MLKYENYKALIGLKNRPSNNTFLIKHAKKKCFLKIDKLLIASNLNFLDYRRELSFIDYNTYKNLVVADKAPSNDYKFYLVYENETIALYDAENNTLAYTFKELSIAKYCYFFFENNKNFLEFFKEALMYNINFNKKIHKEIDQHYIDNYKKLLKGATEQNIDYFLMFCNYDTLKYAFSMNSNKAQGFVKPTLKDFISSIHKNITDTLSNIKSKYNTEETKNYDKELIIEALEIDLLRSNELIELYKHNFLKELEELYNNIFEIKEQYTKAPSNEITTLQEDYISYNDNADILLPIADNISANILAIQPLCRKIANKAIIDAYKYFGYVLELENEKRELTKEYNYLLKITNDRLINIKNKQDIIKKSNKDINITNINNSIKELEGKQANDIAKLCELKEQIEELEERILQEEKNINKDKNKIDIYKTLKDHKKQISITEFKHIIDYEEAKQDYQNEAEILKNKEKEYKNKINTLNENEIQELRQDIEERKAKVSELEKRTQELSKGLLLVKNNNIESYYNVSFFSKDAFVNNDNKVQYQVNNLVAYCDQNYILNYSQFSLNCLIFVLAKIKSNNTSTIIITNEEIYTFMYNKKYLTIDPSKANKVALQNAKREFIEAIKVYLGLQIAEATLITKDRTNKKYSNNAIGNLISAIDYRSSNKYIKIDYSPIMLEIMLNNDAFVNLPRLATNLTPSSEALYLTKNMLDNIGIAKNSYSYNTLHKRLYFYTRGEDKRLIDICEGAKQEGAYEGFKFTTDKVIFGKDMLASQSYIDAKAREKARSQKVNKKRNELKQLNKEIERKQNLLKKQ